MKITRLKVRKVTGTMPVDGTFWEERLVRPIDVYEDYRRDPWAEGGEQIANDKFRMTQYFLEVHTDDGVVGTAGPIWPDAAHLALTQLQPIVVGKDPLAIELLFDQMHRLQVHGRQGFTMIAISAIECALWDLKGKVFQQPIWRILGGPTRQEVPAYCSMLGYAVLDLGMVRDRALEFKEKGFKAQKWFFRHGPMSGHEGMRANVALVRTLRETLGEDYDIMLDCWQSMNLDYAVDLCSRIEEYRPRWIEECFMPDRIDSHVKLKAKTKIPLSGAEHEYTRWGFKRFIEKDALDIIQPDIYWCGGLSETLKIAAYATVHDLITIPHGHSTPIGIHFSVTQSPIHTPYQEYLWKWNLVNMFFLKNPLWPVNGMIALPDAPGVNMDLDPDKIEHEEEMRG
ncbi:MAG TPA: enolase C-terminal domain-like protein [Geminicoccus sp.]|jgi:L-alanine-DL-glutamate epimerase-like enolase superfamily enzyme|uniref:enolase C-terminal domain-like protein n=1 Tax=Geminicoccus sp. TaxID=2024832 RepID=UPI002E340FD1|nr:enolase C-terminal domain-like protein [Geminicoccus sp.]HEX2529439.1 enolase C-terminal domain-like protein [Geminicoccus sp.]